MDGSADAAALFTAGSVAFCAIASIRLCASSSPRAFSVAIAASRSCGGGAVAGGEDRGPRVLERGGHAWIAFLGELRLEGRSALASRVLNTSSAASRRFSGSGLARVSDPIAPSIALRRALLTRTFLKAAALGREWLAGLGVDQRAGRGLVGHEMIGGVDHEAIVAERFEDSRGLRRRLRREFANGFFGLRKLVLEEPREGVVKRVGLGRAGREQRDSQAERARATRNAR